MPRYAKRHIKTAIDAVLAGKTAHKALALALDISPKTLTAWLEQQADFAVAVADARADFARHKAETVQVAGRKSLYSPEVDDNARLHAAAGKNDAAIAAALDVSVTTLRNWRQRHESFHLALQQGRDTWNVTAVEESLIKRALGYEFQEDVIEHGPKGIRTVNTTRHIPPDTRAAQFVLTNRAPERWRLKQEVEIAGLDTLALRLERAAQRHES